MNLQIAARTVKQPAATQTYLNPMLYARSSPPTPAPMISRLTLGTVARAVVFSAARSVMNAVREVSGRPSGKTASAILAPRLAVSFPEKIALSSKSCQQLYLRDEPRNLQMARPIDPPNDRMPIIKPLVIEINS